MPQSAPNSPAPPAKDKKNKKRQKAAAAAAAAAAGSASGAGQPGGSPRKSAVETRPRRSAASKCDVYKEGPEMYGEEIQLPKSVKRRMMREKGKGKALQIDSDDYDDLDSNEKNLDSGMEDGEVNENDQLFFLDTTPGDVPTDLGNIKKPVLPSRKGSASPSPRPTRSPSPAAQALVEDKVLPDYVGTSSEIKEVDAVKDDGIYPVEGSSKDLLDAIVGYSNQQAEEASGAVKRETQTSERQVMEPPAVEASRGSAHRETAPTVEAHVKPEGTMSTSAEALLSSPSGVKRKADHEALASEQPKKKQAGPTSGDLLSDDDSDTSEDEHSSHKLVKNAADATADASESDGESSGAENGGPHDLELNMEIDLTGSARPSPPLPMEVDLVGSAVPSHGDPELQRTTTEETKSKQVEGPSGFTMPDISRETSDLGQDDEDLEAPEGVDVDDFQADRSRYFKEDAPLKLCARCGETGHTVRDCVHVQCLTCGKLDDHGTRSCPLTMTCFRCNSRGHQIKDCPMSAEEARRNMNQFCERCSSHTHQSSTCPYIWRVYIRAPDAPTKPPKIHFACYNCASAEHFGDDCKFPRGRNNERTAFTIDGGNNRNKSHIRFDRESSSASSIPRPNIVNGKIVNNQKEVSPPPSHAPKGPKAMKQAAKRERRSQEKAIRLGDKHTIADTKSKSRPSLEEDIRHFEQQKQKRTDDFGDMGDLEAGEIDEEAEAFEKRLDRNKNLQSSKPTAAQRPGARDRRRARENGSKTNTDSSVARDQNSGKNFQPFKNFVEPPGVNGTSLNRPRSLSRSPPPAKRRRDARQPSPVPMDSPASSKSVKKWKEKRAIYGKIQPGKSATANGGGGFASGSLLDRIERGTNSSDSRTPASRDPRNFDDRPPPTKYTPHAETGTGRYTPHAEPSSRRGGNPHYRGGYF